MALLVPLLTIFVISKAAAETSFLLSFMRVEICSVPLVVLFVTGLGDFGVANVRWGFTALLALRQVIVDIHSIESLRKLYHVEAGLSVLQAYQPLDLRIVENHVSGLPINRHVRKHLPGWISVLPFD